MVLFFSKMRRNLGFYSILNALGPLLNPMQVQRQVVGVYSPLLQDQLAEVLQAQECRGCHRGEGDLGLESRVYNCVCREAMLVHGEDGLDELTLSGATRVVHLKNGSLKTYSVCPEDFGLSRAPLKGIQGGSATDNAGILIRILRGEKGPKRDIVLLNVAAALMVAGMASNFREGVRIASHTIDSGLAYDLLCSMQATPALNPITAYAPTAHAPLEIPDRTSLVGGLQ